MGPPAQASGLTTGPSSTVQNEHGLRNVQAARNAPAAAAPQTPRDVHRPVGQVVTGSQTPRDVLVQTAAACPATQSEQNGNHVPAAQALSPQAPPTAAQIPRSQTGTNSHGPQQGFQGVRPSSPLLGPSGLRNCSSTPGPSGLRNCSPTSRVESRARRGSSPLRPGIAPPASAGSARMTGATAGLGGRQVPSGPRQSTAPRAVSPTTVPAQPSNPQPGSPLVVCRGPAVQVDPRNRSASPGALQTTNCGVAVPGPAYRFGGGRVSVTGGPLQMGSPRQSPRQARR